MTIHDHRWQGIQKKTMDLLSAFSQQKITIDQLQQSFFSLINHSDLNHASLISGDALELYNVLSESLDLDEYDGDALTGKITIFQNYYNQWQKIKYSNLPTW